MLRGAVPNNSRVVLATAAHVEIVVRRRSLSGEGRSPEGEGGAVGGTRQEAWSRSRKRGRVGRDEEQEACRRGEMWEESSSRNTPHEEHPHRTQHFSILNTEDFSVLYRARGSVEGPCRIQRHRPSRALRLTPTPHVVRQLGPGFGQTLVQPAPPCCQSVRDSPHVWLRVDVDARLW